MTKLNWDKADEYVPDPGAVVEVPDVTRPYKHVSTDEKARRRAETRREEKERGKAIRQEELNAKWAEHASVEYWSSELGGLLKP